jgi:DNA-binding MarR family transcriptional regulator
MSSAETTRWTFLTNHAQVLLCVANDPDIRLRDVAETVGITERAAQRIVADLAEAGFLERERHGRRNRYLINKQTEMRHPAQEGYEIGELLDLLRQVRSSHDGTKQLAD